MVSVPTSAVHVTRHSLRGLTLKHIVVITQVRNLLAVNVVVNATRQNGMKHSTFVELFLKGQ
jgi:hypothetical protein